MNADDILKKHNLSPPTVGNDPVDQIAAKHGLKPPKPERGWLRAGADVGLSAVEGAVTGGRMVAEAAGANNIASRGLARMAEGLRGMRSAASQAEDYDAARRAREAAGKGAGAETVASWESFKERPAHYLAQAVGTSIPTLAAMALTRGRVNPLAVGGGMGAVMGAGETKGGIYESVYQEALNAGKTEDDARAIAEKAQSYTGKNLDNILAGTGIGALAGATGVERAFGGSLARKAAPGIAKNVLRKGATEAGTEYIQEGHQALAGNIAAQREGFNVPTMEGVYGQAAHGALAGFAAGGMFGAGESLVAQPPATRDPTVDVIGDEVAGTQQQDAAPAMPPTGGFTPEEVAAFRNEQAENQKRMERDLAIQRGMADYEAQQRDSDALLEREKQAKQQEMLAQIHQRIAEVEAAKQLEAQRKAEEQAETFVDPRIAARVAASKDAGTDVIDSILPPSPEVEHAEEINIGPLGKAANVAKGTGSFKQIGEFADLVTQERADIEQRRNQQKGAADALQGQRQEATETVTTPATPLQETEPVTQQADVPSAQTATAPEKAEASLQSEPDTFTKPDDSKQEIDLREQIASLVKGKREADQFGTRNALDSAQQKAMSAMSGAKVMPAYFRNKAADMRKRNDTTNADTLDAIADAIAAHNKAVKAAATPESEKQAKAEAFKKRMAESRAKKQGAKDEAPPTTTQRPLGVVRDTNAVERELVAKAAPVLDLSKNPTGWKSVDFDNGRLLVSFDGKKSIVFKSANERSGTELVRAVAKAHAFAIDNPYTTSVSEGELVATPLFKEKANETSAVLPESNQGRSDQQGRSEGVVERPAGEPRGKRSAAKPAVRAPKAGAVVDAKEQDGAGLIFGRTFDDIKRAQQGGRLDRVIDVTKPPTSDMTTERLSEDKALLEAHGVDGLEKKGFHGVLDRLRRSGVIDGEGAKETKSAAKPEQVATQEGKTEGKEAAPDAVKPIWQMLEGEAGQKYIEETALPKLRKELAGIKSGEIKTGKFTEYKSKAEAIRRLNERIESLENPDARARKYYASLAGHYAEVRKALERGEKVPASALQGYDDLRSDIRKGVFKKTEGKKSSARSKSQRAVESKTPSKEVAPAQKAPDGEKPDDAKLSRQPSQPQTYRVLSPEGKFIGTRELDGKQARELKDRGYTLTPWRLSRGGKGGITTDTAKSIAEAFVKAHKGSADIKVVANIEAIKDSDLYKQIAARGALNDVEGASYKGDIYLFPQNLESDIRAAEVLMHEGRHFAFAAIKGEGLNNVMAGIYKSNPLVRNAADAKKKTLGLKDIAEATEEALADMDVKQLRDLKGWPILVAHIKAKVREMAKALDKAGFINAASWLNERVNTWTDADVARLLKDADTLVTKPRAVDTAGDDDAKLQRVWHGTPHIWAPEPGFPHGRPRLDKIGTGEGAQAYGWGFYAAQAEDVGTEYQRKLANIGTDGYQTAHSNAQAVVAKYDGDEEWAIEVLESTMGGLSDNDTNRGRISRTLEMIRDGSYKNPLPVAGSLYQLDIPDDVLPYLLDWNKPLSEQTPEVRDALKRGGSIAKANPRMSGREIYESVARNAPDAFGLNGKSAQQVASEYLASIGIVGNRYLDGQSRNRPLKDIKREFLAELPEDADFAEVSGLIGTGRFSPKNEALIKALRDNDWLGFDYPSQAISAALSKDLSGYDASPALLRAVETAKEGGTYNYVIWDQPTLDKIALLERNGEKLDAIREADARLSRKTEGVRLSTAKTIRPAWLGENGEVNDSVRIDPTLKAIAKGGLGMFESATDRLRRSGAPILIDLADKIDRYYDQSEARIGKINGKLRPVLKEIRKNEKANMADFEEYWRAHDNGREAEAKAILDRNPLVKQLVDVVKDVFDETGTENQNVDTPFGKGMKVYDSRLVKKDGDIIGRIVERNGEKLVYQNGELVGTLTGTSIKLAEGFATGRGDGTKLDGVSVGGYRLIGKFKRGEFWPRAFRADVQAVLQNPSTNLALWNEIVDALIDGGYIQKRDEAIAFVNDHFSNESSNDFFAGIEMARGLKLPDAFYDYSYDAFLRYAHKWSTRISQVEQFGQVTQPGQKDAFDNAIGNTLDYRTRNYIEEAKNVVYVQRQHDIYTNALSHLNLLATGLQLGNFSTAALNLIGGTTLNVQMFGLKNTVNAFIEMAKDWKNISQKGTELGILNKDVLKILQDNEIHGQYDIHAVLNQKLSKFTAFTLKWGGYNAMEHIIRTTAMLAARAQLVDALGAWNKDATGHDAKKYREFMERNRIDVDKLIKENGEGTETARYLRLMVNIPQGSYRIDQVPIYIDTPTGRFLFKYQKFATQVTRMFWQQMLQPFVDSIKEGKSGRERVEAFIPVMRFFGSAILGGSAILLARSTLFGMSDPGDDLDDIAKAFENDDTAKAWAMLAGRAHTNMIAAAGYGMFGNYIQFGLDVSDQQRVKNPLSPPGLAPIDSFVEIFQRFTEQGQLTGKDFDQIAERTFSMYRTARRGAATATNTMGIEGIGFAEMEQARRDTLYVRKVARNFAEDYGIEAKRTMTGRIGRTERSPENLEIYEAIMLGDAERARLLIKDALDAADDKKMRLQSIRSAIQSRHPVQLGASPASRMQVVQFRKWARDNLPESKVQRIEELITRYDRTAKMAGL